MEPVDLISIRPLLEAALAEDIGAGDLTSRAAIDPDSAASGRYVAKQALRVAGLPVVAETLRLVDERVRFRALLADGADVEPGTVLGEVEGPARSLLAAERTSLNLLQRLSGIATVTREFVTRVEGTSCRVVDTRKTVPGLRVLDKYAVRAGGGLNHRMGLYDGVLIKNNHLAFHPDVAGALSRVRGALGPRIPIQVEVRNLDELAGAIAGGADFVLLDNFTPEETRRAVEAAAGRVPLESSGGIGIENVRAFAEAGVDYISIGALTHSVRAADIHLLLAPFPPDAGPGKER